VVKKKAAPAQIYAGKNAGNYFIVKLREEG
jgi:hypothetical protein